MNSFPIVLSSDNKLEFNDSVSEQVNELLTKLDMHNGADDSSVYIDYLNNKSAVKENDLTLFNYVKYTLGERLKCDKRAARDGETMVRIGINEYLLSKIKNSLVNIENTDVPELRKDIEKSLREEKPSKF
jgi:hypothetical protein